jgi:CBS domain-containing protein
MNKNVVVAKEDITLKEASEVMSKLRIGCLIISEGHEIFGIITAMDIIKSIANGKNPEITLAKEIMSRNVVTIDPEKTIQDAVDLMIKNKIRRLPIVSEEKIVGMITATDIMVVEPKLISNIASLVSLGTPYSGG